MKNNKRHIDQLRLDLIGAFSPLYEMNDAAHQTDHFEDVYETGCAINGLLNLKYEKRLIMIVSYCHDMFSWSRKNHHVLSSEFIRNTDHKLIFDLLTPLERITVGAACETHRASFRGEFFDDFGQLMNSADRGMPLGAEQLITRAILYSKNKYPELEDHRARAIMHVKDKYGTNGYARYPTMYSLAFGDKLKTQKCEIDEMQIVFH